MSNKMYLILLVLTGISGGLFYLIFRKELHYLLTAENRKDLLTTSPSEPYINPS